MYEHLVLSANFDFWTIAQVEPAAVRAHALTMNGVAEGLRHDRLADLGYLPPGRNR